MFDKMNKKKKLKPMLITYYGNIKCSEIKQFQANIKCRTKFGNVLVKILLNLFFFNSSKKKKKKHKQQHSTWLSTDAKRDTISWMFEDSFVSCVLRHAMEDYGASFFIHHPHPKKTKKKKQM